VDAKGVKLAEKPQKMAKNCAKKDWLKKENIFFLWL